jgi:hypothetical protein
MRHALTARLLGAGALAAALLLGAGCRDNASPEENALELQQPASGAAPAAPGTGGAGSAGTEAPQPGDTQPTDMSGRPATGNTESGTQGGGVANPARDSSYGGVGPGGPITPDEVDMMPDDYRHGWSKDGAKDSEAGSEPQAEEKGASPGGRTPPGHELETR